MKIHGLVSVLFVLSNLIAHSTGKALSFEVLSVIPSNNDGRDQKLYGNTPLTAVFSLPVIRLGEQLQLNPTPFELLECADASKQLPLEKLGRFRWVSTSIVRFDPATDWPPDLCFKLVIKSTLKTHDGLRLTGSYSAGYQTSPLTMYAGEVRSKMALAVTGGRWESHTDKGGYNECPMDGIVHLKFSHPVIPSRVLTALTLDKGAGLRDWFNKKGAYFDDWVGSCSGSQEQEETNAADTDTPLKCVSVKPRNLRSDGTLYNLKLPRSSRVSFLGGSTQKEQTVRLMGALPFKFRFKQETMPNIVTTLAYNSYKEKRPRFRRYALYLRHGLQILVDAANANKDPSLVDLSPLKDSMRLTDVRTNRAIDFTLNATNLATLVFYAAFNPNQQYMIEVVADDAVLDGFGMPLQSSASTFRTQDSPSFFANPSASIFVFPSTAVSSGVLTSWPVVTRGKQVVDRKNQAADMHCTPVTEDNFARVVVAQLQGNVKTIDLDKIWASAATQSVSLPMKDELSVVGCPDISGLLQGSLSGSKHSGMFYVVKRGKWPGSLHQQIVVVSDLSVVFIPSTNGQNQVTAWVTDSTGADVICALVRLFSLRYYAPTNSYGNTIHDNTVTLVGTAITDAEGIASVPFNLKDPKNSKLVALITHADTGGVAFEPDVPMPVSLRTDRWQVRIHTDRGIYKPGDDVHVKIVARVRLGGMAGKDSGRLRVPTPSRRSQFFLQVQWRSQAEPSYEPVTLSEAFGTASLKLTVPMDADIGPLNLHLARFVANQNDFFSNGEKILIADPRPPTVTMDLSLHSAVDTDKHTGLLVVPPGAKAGVDVRVVTKTQTGAFVEKAKVAVKWTLVRGTGALKPGDDAPFSPKPRSSVYGLDPALLGTTTTGPTPYTRIKFDKGEVSGEFTIVTALGGVGLLRFDLASALSEQRKAPAQIGDLLEVSAQWIGPTREVVREKKSVPVADSPYAVGVALSVNDPLPGIHFGVRLDVRVAPNAVMQANASAVSKGIVESDEYKLSLHKWTQETAKAFTAAVKLDGTSIQDSLLKFLSTPQLDTVQVNHACKGLINDGGATTQCDGQVHLPAIGEYLLVVQNKAAVGGERVVAALVLGRSLASWEDQPLSVLASGLGVIADRSQYSEGDVATLAFVSPFVGTTPVLVVWGNCVSGQASRRKKLRLQGAGKHTFTIELGAECRGGCVVDTIVTAPAQSAAVELPVPVPLSNLLQMKVSRTVIMHTTLAVRDPDVPTNQPKVTISFPGGGQSEFVLSPGETTNLLVDVDLTAYSGVEAEVMIYATDQAFLDLEPHPLPKLAPFFTLGGVDHRPLTDTRRYSASAVGLQSSIATFTRRFAADPWVCPDSFPLRPDQVEPWHNDAFDVLCDDQISGQIPEVDETDSAYFKRYQTAWTHFPSRAHPRSHNRDIFLGDSMPMKTMSRGIGGDRSMPNMALNDMMVNEMTFTASGPESGPTPSAPTSPGVKLRTNVETTPLFIGSVNLNAHGRATVTFIAPDNIARFAVRAVVVGNKAAPGVFAETETHLIVRKALSLMPSQPRIVRSRDTFNCGVTATLQRAKFEGVLNVLARIRSQDKSQQRPLLYFSGDNTTHYYVTQRVTGSGPHEIVFPFIAHNSAIGSTTVEFYAQGVSPGGSPVTDALQVNIIAGPVSDPVMLATSVSIAAAAEAAVWSEGITLPKAIPGSGSIVLRAGAGHLPAVLQCASALNSERDENWRNGEAIVSALAAPAALGEYYLTAQAREAGWGDGGAGYVAAEGLKLAVPALQRFTDHSRGLFWRPSVRDHTPSVRLNAKGAFLAGAALDRLETDLVLKQAIGGQSAVDLITKLKGQWVEAAWRGLQEGVNSCRSGNVQYCWTDCDALAAARLVLPLDRKEHQHYTASGKKTTDLSEETLYAPDYIKLCTVGGQADAALVQLIRHEKDAKASAKAKAILLQLIQQLRVQGQAAYITASPHSAYPASWEAHAKALLALSLPNSGLSDHPLVTKLAAWVSSGGGRPGFIPPALAFASLALARYDRTRGNTNVDAWLIARTGGQVLLEGEWKNPSDPVVRTETLWDALSVMKNPFGIVPEPLVFRVKGRGEVSVSAQLRYLPVDVPSAGGFYQGISVEKVIEMADMGSGDRIPGAVSIAGLGDLVVVTIQVSTPDMLSAVIVSDLLPGGLEPVDPNVGDGGGLNPTSSCGQGSLRARWWCWDPFADRETRPDRVDWFAHQLWPGTHTIRYHARAVTSGIFQVPGTAARVTDTPEVMGVSAGGKFVVSATPVSHLTAAQKSDILRQRYSVQPAIVKDCGDCAAQNAVCNDAVGECVCPDGSAMSNGKCTALPLLPPPYHKSVPFNVALGIKTRDASVEDWNLHRRALRKSMSRTLLLNLNADSPEDCPSLSLGEHDVTIDQVDQKDTSSAVVHASVALWGPTGNLVATRYSGSVRQSIASVIANGRLAQSVQELAALGDVPQVTMGGVVEAPTASAITTAPGECKRWCDTNKQTWKKKCTWPGLCDGCPECPDNRASATTTPPGGSVFSPQSKAELKTTVKAYLKRCAQGDCSDDPYGQIGEWDVSRVTDMNRIFMGALSFNGDISKWGVSRVTDMGHMFFNALSFNGDLSKWDMASVNDISGMFNNAKSFNGDLSKWDVASVTDMSGMFKNANSFNGDLSKWDVSSVNDMSGMFKNAKSFNGDLSKWDVTSVNDMSGMFNNAKSFNGDLSKWDVSSVQDMKAMFFDTVSFKQRLCSAAWVHSKANKNTMFTSSSGSISRVVCASAPSPAITQVTRQYVTRRPLPKRDLKVPTSNTVSVSNSLRLLAMTCLKCGTFAKSGRVSCCAPGGAWFKKCGGAANKNVAHRWSEGTEACKPRTTTTSASVCPKCGTVGKSGKMSCCGRGGSWFRNCGGAGNKRLQHTWKEGIHACKARSRSRIALAQQENAVQPKGIDSSHGSEKATTAAKPLAFSSADMSTSILLVDTTSLITTANTSASRAVSTHPAYDTPTTNSKEIDGMSITIISISVNMETSHPSFASVSISITAQGCDKMLGIVLHISLLIMIVF